jgi:hypothetical protein
MGNRVRITSIIGFHISQIVVSQLSQFELQTHTLVTELWLGWRKLPITQARTIGN